MSAKKVALKKPKAKKREGVTYDYHEVMRYIEKKYNIDVDDYAGKFKAKDYDEKIPYQNYWHWIGDTGDVHNGCYLSVPLEVNTDEKYMPKFVQEITALLAKEFGKQAVDGYLETWVEW